MEILVVVRLCCNCTYGEARWGGFEFGCRWGAMLRGCWLGAGCPCWGRGSCIVLCSLKLGASLFQALLNHLGSGTWGHALAFAAGQGLVPAVGRRGTGAGGGGIPSAWAVPRRMAMGSGLRLLDGGWEHRGAGTPVFLWLGRRSSGHPCLLVPGPMLPACGFQAGGTVPARSPTLLALCQDSPSRGSPVLCVCP